MTITTNYDEKYDILYLRPSAFVPTYADEDDNGITTLRSITDDSVVGMVIDGFKERFFADTLQDASLPLPLDLSDPVIQSYLFHAN